MGLATISVLTTFYPDFAKCKPKSLFFWGGRLKKLGINLRNFRVILCIFTIHCTEIFQNLLHGNIFLPQDAS